MAMKASKFVQLDPRVLMEYIYEDYPSTPENYIISHDLNQDIKSYSSVDMSGSNNRYSNQLVLIDPIRNKYGVHENDYNFIQDQEFIQSLPIRYDKIKLHFPGNFNFSDYVGCYLRVYVMDYSNRELISLSNYFLDKQDASRLSRELELSSPPISLNGKQWGKYIEIPIPSPNQIARQRTNNIPSSNTINYNISSGVGISDTSPIMIEFGFITKKDVTNGVNTYILRSPYQTSIPQTPNFENLTVKIEANPNGDWFDIYGTYNGNISEFNKWIGVSRQSGKNYYVEYDITMFEENIRRKTLTTVITEDFNDKVEYRPIIKYSSTTASIEVIMRVIDRVDDSIITRRASYGMLSDELSKYSRSLVRITTENKKTPKIYNIRSGGSISDAFNGLNNRKGKSNSENLYNSDIFGHDIQTIKVPYPILTNSSNIVAKSKSSLVDDKIWYGKGKLKIIVNPFDNIFKFTLASNVRVIEPQQQLSLQQSTSRVEVAKQIAKNEPIMQVDYFDLVNMGTLNLYFKNNNRDIVSPLYRNTGEVDLKNGTIVFKLDRNKVNEVRQIYESGINMFYITSTNEDTNEITVIYDGTFIMSDSIDYVDEVSHSFQESTNNENIGSGVQIDRSNNRETAIVTRRVIK